jgi:hypothetical protein
MVTSSRICVLTLAIGPDYRRNLEKALKSKRDYCARHGYTYLELHEEVWDRDRPISWSKVTQYIKYCGMSDKYDYIWASDADVWITNPELRLEDHVLPLLPADKNLLMTYDSCRHVNAGNMIIRPCEWSVKFFKKVWQQEDCLYHIWWENAAICKLMSEDHTDSAANIQVTMEAYRFNAYLQGYKGTRQWLPGDFLIHFAGVYDSKKMLEFMENVEAGKIPRIPM